MSPSLMPRQTLRHLKQTLIFFITNARTRVVILQIIFNSPILTQLENLYTSKYLSTRYQVRASASFSTSFFALSRSEAV